MVLGRSSKRIGLLLVAGLVFAVLGTTGTASAAIHYDCTFGPQEAGPTYAATFKFASLPGLGNDTLFINGKGWCTTQITPPCPVGLLCDIGFASDQATIQGSASEVTGGNTLHFGRCDADPAPPYAPGPGNLVVDHVKLTFVINGFRTVVRYLKLPPNFSSPEDIGNFLLLSGRTFPDALQWEGTLYKDQAETIYDGSVALRTRIGGLCPSEGGNFRAYFDRITLTAPAN